MTIEILLALTLFAFSSSVTPGPNNMMLMASGANFGFKQTIPHMLGIAIGFSIMLVLVGIGIIQLFNLFPLTYVLLKYLSIIYLLYLAYKIATTADHIKSSSATSRPFSFIKAAGFQWVNPKAWTMALTTLSVYVSDHNLSNIIVAAIVFGLVNLPSVSIWTILGQQLQRWLTDLNRLRLFNRTMGGLLVLSLYPMIF
jgi:threonine/homoserine/homoserine lactone efflux protein